MCMCSSDSWSGGISKSLFWRLRLCPMDLSLCMSSSISERCQSSTHIQLHTSHCCKGGCLVLYRAEHVLGGACQQQSQLSGRSRMADLWTAVISRKRCPLPDALAAWILRLPSPLFFNQQTLKIACGAVGLRGILWRWLEIGKLLFKLSN